MARRKKQGWSRTAVTAAGRGREARPAPHRADAALEPVEEGSIVRPQFQSCARCWGAAMHDGHGPALCIRCTTFVERSAS